MYGYTVKNSIDVINYYCEEPERYSKGVLQSALNDAFVHYQYGKVSKAWYEYVVQKLTPYIKNKT